ncbi:MAG: efflux RND transporter periplasmic adaptor subunit [Verrucomicrobia bacterium]|nr:efflux RND transporter periplasmic adaptor subunit [Verrucomicrobiota bacterium]
MIKRMILMLVVVLLLLGGIFGTTIYKGIKTGKAMAAEKPPAITVSKATARAESWQPALRTVGSLTAVQGVVVSNELAGVVEKIEFESGQVVQKGALLVQLNTATEQAQLRSFEAAAELGRQNLERAKKLRNSNVNAQADLDAAEALFQQAVANAENLRAAIAKKAIVAPFGGRLGIRQVNLGQFLAVGTSIVALQSLDPIYVNFTLPQHEVRNVRTGQPVALTIDAYPGTEFKGEITAFDSRLDEATRTVRVQATLGNGDGRLQAGMFAGVAVLLPQRENVITVPQTAITYNPYGNVVYVIEAATGDGAPPAKGANGEPVLTVRQQFVKVGETRGDQVAILGGLKAGDEIVTAGQLKLRNGVHVRVDNTVPVANSPKPNPPNT